ncbi:DUF1963 domain-containing protein [Streptomyces tanashiensis]|uniref:DUF1963 domain-containing protein n=1 Tax=Streptomyces tanashiensis TaxID=67367 RepID=UPI0016730F91|nr:DUF1963 domain-containing protein [Streptomyces tanashiensis]
MTRQTPPRPVDVEQLFPEVVPLRKETVRLHPRAGAPTCRDSSVGGPLLWPAEEAWPQCPEHEEAPMVPVVQIYRSSVPDIVPFPDECDLLQVLWCPRKHSGYRWVVPHVQWREAGAVRNALAAPPSPAEVWKNYVPRPCVVHPEPVTEYPYWDLHDDMWDELEFRFLEVDEETGWDYQSHLSTAPGTKLVGYPGWCQDPKWPDCSGCGNRMEHLLTVQSTEADALSRRAWVPTEDTHMPYEGPGLVLGDLGGVYLFECRTCPGRPFTHRYDCP